MIINPLLQRHVEPFMRLLREAGIDPTAPFLDKSLGEQVETAGVIARSASRSEMLNGTNPDDLEPWQTMQLAASILNAVWSSLTTPKASSSPQPPTPADAESVPKS